MQSPLSFRLLMREDFPPEFFLSVAKLVNAAYARAYDTVHKLFSAEEAHDLLPMYRRAEVEKALVQAAAAFQNVTTARKLNTAGNSYHVEVTCGRFVLTSAAVHYPREVVRSAIYRDNLLDNPQIAFSFMGEDEEHSKSEYHYGLILHGPHPNDPRRTGFINLGFLDGDATGYHANFAMRDLYAASVGTPAADSSEEKIDDKAKPQIRKDIQKNDTNDAQS